MALSQQIRQIQSQRISPAMMMEFSLLQLPIGELKDAVQREVATNPALEVSSDFVSRGAVSMNADGVASGIALENVRDTRGETLDEHILGELRMNGVEGRELSLAGIIVENLNEDGFLTASTPDLIMELEGRGVTKVSGDELENARQRVMRTDPCGCGARDLIECFRAQVFRLAKSKQAEAMRAVDILERALKENRLKDLSSSELKAVQVLKNFERQPGRLYERAETVFVKPDIHFDKFGRVAVDQGDVPELRVSQKYIEMAKDRELDKETREYAAERVKRAREFHEALLRRKETMIEIAEATLSRQTDFLTRGKAGLKKLTMSEIAKETKSTIPTVSRAAARKYVKTPRGTMPFRSFFVLVDQEPLEALREVLESRPKNVHVSDAVIAEEITKKGYPMARRTVAKYRLKWGL